MHLICSIPLTCWSSLFLPLALGLISEKRLPLGLNEAHEYPSRTDIKGWNITRPLEQQADMKQMNWIQTWLQCWWSEGFLEPEEDNSYCKAASQKGTANTSGSEKTARRAASLPGDRLQGDASTSQAQSEQKTIVIFPPNIWFSFPYSTGDKPVWIRHPGQLRNQTPRYCAQSQGGCAILQLSICIFPFLSQFYLGGPKSHL